MKRFITQTLNLLGAQSLNHDGNNEKLDVSDNYINL